MMPMPFNHPTLKLLSATKGDGFARDGSNDDELSEVGNELLKVQGGPSFS